MDQVLDQINKRLAELEKIHTRYQGPRGPAGKDAPSPKIMIGTITSGDQADAKIRTVDGTFVLDLCLPRGTDGRDGYSNLPGPRGRDGADALTTIAVGQVVGGREAMASLRHEGDVVILDLVLPRGSQGEQGSAGRDASIEDIRRVVVEVLSSAEMRNAFRGEAGRNGKDSTVPGPRGSCGPEGLRGPVGDSPTEHELRTLIRQVIDENPEQFRGPIGHAGRDGKDAVGMRGPQGKPGDISAAAAQAEAEAKSIVKEALVEIHERLARLERATK